MVKVWGVFGFLLKHALPLGPQEDFELNSATAALLLNAACMEREHSSFAQRSREHSPGTCGTEPCSTAGLSVCLQAQQ